MSELSILFIGDIVGEVGLEAVESNLAGLKSRFSADCVIVNGENICDGKGLGEKEANRLFAAGADIITTGNHIWENWKARPLLSANKRVLRPYNYPAGNPGTGIAVCELADGRKVGVIQMQGTVYMSPIDCPFRCLERILPRMKEEATVIFVDFHAEASAEKIAYAWNFDGQVSVIAGTHTHVQTADNRVFPGGTAFITDVGMSGPYDSVIGMKKDIAIRRFTLQTAHKYEVAEGDVRIAGICARIDDQTGKALSIERFLLPEW